MAEQLLVHKGACHCGALKFEFDAPSDVDAWDCTCSICRMKKNTHVFVPESRFRLLQGAGTITEYRFGTQKAQHLFCSVCGVQAFYRPRSHPGSYAVTLECVEPGTLAVVRTRTFDGRDWEAAYERAGFGKA